MAAVQVALMAAVQVALMAAVQCKVLMAVMEAQATQAARAVQVALMAAQMEEAEVLLLISTASVAQQNKLSEISRDEPIIFNLLLKQLAKRLTGICGVR